MDSIFVCILLCWTTPKNFRANSSSCFWDEILQLPKTQFFWKMALKLKTSKFHVNCTIFWQIKNHLFEKYRNTQFWPSAAFVNTLKCVYLYNVCPSVIFPIHQTTIFNARECWGIFWNLQVCNFVFFYVFSLWS